MDGIQSFLKQSGVHCLDMDIANVGANGELKEHNDLASDHLWEIILGDIRTDRVKALGSVPRVPRFQGPGKFDRAPHLSGTSTIRMVFRNLRSRSSSMSRCA